MSQKDSDSSDPAQSRSDSARARRRARRCTTADKNRQTEETEQTEYHKMGNLDDKNAVSTSAVAFLSVTRRYRKLPYLQSTVVVVKAHTVRTNAILGGAQKIPEIPRFRNDFTKTDLALLDATRGGGRR